MEQWSLGCWQSEDVDVLGCCWLVERIRWDSDFRPIDVSYQCVALRVEWLQSVGCETRYTFCGTWYLPHRQVHNERSVSIIMAGCIALAPSGGISTSGLKSDVTIVFSTPIFFMTRKFRRFDHIIRVILHIFLCACAKGSCFHFRFKLWRRHRASRPRFSERRANVGDLRTLQADIGLLNTCVDFQDLLA